MAPHHLSSDPVLLTCSPGFTTSTVVNHSSFPLQMFFDSMNASELHLNSYLLFNNTQCITLNVLRSTLNECARNWFEFWFEVAYQTRCSLSSENILQNVVHKWFLLSFSTALSSLLVVRKHNRHGRAKRLVKTVNLCFDYQFCKHSFASKKKKLYSQMYSLLKFSHPFSLFPSLFSSNLGTFFFAPRLTKAPFVRV